MSWVVLDSEDEGDLNAVRNLPLQTHSSISDFSTRGIILPETPATEKTSIISDFSTDNIVAVVNSNTDTILDVSTSADGVPPKPKRPKPRPAYGRVRTEDTVSSIMSNSAASVTANAINRTVPGSSHQPLSEPTFSLDIAEKTRSRKRFATTGDDSILEGSSRDIIFPGGEHARSAARSNPISGAIHTAPFQSPSLGWEPSKLASTPPSSPFQPKRKKRRILADDFNFLDDTIDFGGDAASSSILVTKDTDPSAKKQKRSKVQGIVEDGNASIAKSSSTNAKQRKSKAKEKSSEQEFKSKEFIEESDDDLLLVPQSSKSKPRAARSDIGSAGVSVDASNDVSIEASVLPPTRTGAATNSVMPSLSAPVQCLLTASELPLADVSAPPPSPSVPQTCQPDRSESKKRKKKRKSEVASSGAADNSDALMGDTGGQTFIADIPQDVPSSVVAPPNRRDKKQKRGKKGKEVVPPSLPKDAGNQDIAARLSQSDSEERNNLEAGKSRSKEKKGRKKRSTVVSSDEDGPDSALTEGNPVEMEPDKIKDTEIRNDDKENQPLPPPKDRPENKPKSASQAPPHLPNPKSQTSTPKMPSRRDSMSMLIRRVSSKVQSPLGTPSPAYSPLAKVSRTALSRIAPLHPNRRTPPPPPPRPPPPKKSKKMLALEEKWEEELAETIEGWSCMTDEERAALRRAKRDAELGYDD